MTPTLARPAGSAQMADGLLIVSLERAGGHAAPLGIVLLFGVVCGLAYALVHFFLKSPPPSERDGIPDRSPAA